MKRDLRLSETQKSLRVNRCHNLLHGRVFLRKYDVCYFPASGNCNSNTRPFFDRYAEKVRADGKHNLFEAGNVGAVLYGFQQVLGVILKAIKFETS